MERSLLVRPLDERRTVRGKMRLLPPEKRSGLFVPLRSAAAAHSDVLSCAMRPGLCHVLSAVMMLLTAAPAVACDLSGAGLTLDRSEELRDDFYLWIELHLYREATAEWTRTTRTISAAALRLDGCPPSADLLGIEGRLALMRKWSRRAEQTKMDRFRHGRVVH